MPPQGLCECCREFRTGTNSPETETMLDFYETVMKMFETESIFYVRSSNPVVCEICFIQLHAAKTFFDMCKLSRCTRITIQTKYLIVKSEPEVMETENNEPNEPENDNEVLVEPKDEPPTPEPPTSEPATPEPPTSESPTSESQTHGVSELLREWQMEHLIPIFVKAKIDVFVLKHLNEARINMLIPDVRNQVYFQDALEKWKAASVQSTVPKLITVPSASNQTDSPERAEDIDLERILSTKKGAVFIDYLNINGFNDTARGYLIEAICDTFLSKKLHMSPLDFSRIATQITENFPEEDTINYYVPASKDRNGKHINAGGKLFNRYHCAKRKLRNDGIMQSKFAPSAKITKPCEPEPPEPEVTNMEEQENLKQYLRSNHLDFSALEVKWRKTEKLRKSDLRNSNLSMTDILREWPKYAARNGNFLVEIDFECYYPNINRQSLLLGWDQLMSNAEKYCKDNVKNPETLQLSKQLGDCLNKDSRHLIIVYQLHAILKPTTNFEYVDNNVKRIHRPGILDSRKSMVLHVQSAADVDKAIADVRSNYLRLGLKLQPFVVAIGRAITKVDSFIVVVDDLRFTFSNLANAIDLCLKSVYVFGRQYQKESERVWKLFDNLFFFPLKMSRDNADILLISKKLK